MIYSKISIAFKTIIGKILSIYGYVVGVFSLLFICVALASINQVGSKEVIILFLFILPSCIFSVIMGIRIKRRLKHFKQYAGLISIEQITSIEGLANSTSQSIDFVSNDLQSLIHKGYFTNVYIDKHSKEIVIGDIDSQTVLNTKTQSEKQNSNVSVETVKCPGCGATNTKQKDKVCQCEYCGSVL